MKNTLTFVLVFLSVQFCFAQKFFTKEGHVSFTSEAPMETIVAHNNKATCVVDATSNAMQWSVLIRAFKFEKALMEEHFNENYMESSEFPKATFKGAIVEGDVYWNKDGNYDISVEGALTIHGIKQKVNYPAQIRIIDGEIKVKSEFPITIADFGIRIPGVVEHKIADDVAVKVEGTLEKLK